MSVLLSRDRCIFLPRIGGQFTIGFMVSFLLACFKTVSSTFFNVPPNLHALLCTAPLSSLTNAAEGSFRGLYGSKPGHRHGQLRDGRCPLHGGRIGQANSVSGEMFIQVPSRPILWGPRTMP